MSDTNREVLRARGISPVERAKLDLEKLWAMPEFKRFLFRIFVDAYMYTGTYGNDGRHLAFAEGRRSLGFDILRTVEKLSIDAQALILAEAAKSQLEAPNARSYDRLSELNDQPRGGSNRHGDGLTEWVHPTDAIGAPARKADEGAGS